MCSNIIIRMLSKKKNTKDFLVYTICDIHFTYYITLLHPDLREKVVCSYLLTVKPLNSCFHENYNLLHCFQYVVYEVLSVF